VIEDKIRNLSRRVEALEFLVASLLRYRGIILYSHAGLGLPDRSATITSAGPGVIETLVSTDDGAKVEIISLSEIKEVIR
jgi:hypothetical protein